MRTFIMRDENGRTSGSWGAIGALIQIKDGSLSVRDDRMLCEAREVNRELKMTHLGEFNRRDRTWHPPAFDPNYKSTVLRSPNRPLLALGQSTNEMTGPVFGTHHLDPLDNDLIANYQQGGEPIGERIIVHGQVLDEMARPVRNSLIEVWQANAGGRYRHRNDTYLAPLDPNFGGCGRVLTDDEGRYFSAPSSPAPIHGAI